MTDTNNPPAAHETVQALLESETEVDRLRAIVENLTYIDPGLRDRLADSMCRHALIADWYEKADLVLADLRPAGPAP